MGKRRFYYDAKGNLRGSSSDTERVTPKVKRSMFLLILAVIGWNAIFGNDEGAETTNPKAEIVEAENRDQPRADPAPLMSEKATVDLSSQEQASSVQPNRNDRMERDQRQRPQNTEEYLQSAYVNGDPNCPRDMIDYLEKQCQSGDEQACRSAKCGSSSDDVELPLNN